MEVEDVGFSRSEELQELEQRFDDLHLSCFIVSSLMGVHCTIYLLFYNLSIIYSLESSMTVSLSISTSKSKSSRVNG
jgi:hypothetical protein